jgi:hypothetical protein
VSAELVLGLVVGLVLGGAAGHVVGHLVTSWLDRRAADRVKPRATWPPLEDDPDPVDARVLRARQSAPRRPTR